MRKKILALMLTVMIGSAQVMTVSAAKTTDELEQQKAQTTAQLSETQDTINNLEAQKEAITSQIGELDAQLVVTMAAVESLKTDIANKQAEIEETQQDQAEQYEALKDRIQYLYENGGNTAWASLLLSGEDLSDILNQAEYTQKMYDYDRECLEKYMAVTQQVSDYSDQLESEKAELEVSEAEQEAQQAELQNMLAEKRATSADYDAQLADMQAKASEYENLIAEQNAQIQAIQEQQAAEEAARQAEAERQAEAARQEAESRSAASQESSSSSSSSRQESSSSSSSSSSNSSKNEAEDTSEDQGSSSNSGSATGQAVVDYAVQFVGNPYVWGGTSLTNGADCSGFIMSVYAHFGYGLPHSSAAMRSVGRGVSYAEAQPGDIICYDGHVAIYMGGGQIVHASNAKDGIKISSNAAYRTILAVRRLV